jgi:hypothetical protein
VKPDDPLTTYESPARAPRNPRTARVVQKCKGSGVELVIDTASIVDLRDERIVRLQGYINPPKLSRRPGCRSR